MDSTRSGLYTDFYELTMAQAYFCSGKHNARATFDLSFRTAPFGGGYAVFAGLEPAIRSIIDFSFSADELAYLRGLGFRTDFLKLLEGFCFSGDVEAFREGDIVFPGDVLMRISAPLMEAQLLESMLLNIINFQTLIATKAMRIVSAARGRPVMDFGLRRAQAEASLAATRAAYIGGTAGTSNTLAAKIFGIPAIGTHAHSWIQSFDDEYTAFSTYARLYPQATTLLVDTYDTLASGVPNAIRVAREMESRGERLRAIRLDSGDMAQLSKTARAMLDEAGFGYVKIVASNQLDEYCITSLLEQHAPIDVFGVGTQMICAAGQPALDGVYKLCEVDGEPKIKLSETAEKINSPGMKKVLRYIDAQGKLMFDALALEQEREEEITCVRHPDTAVQKTGLQRPAVNLDPVFFPVMRTGKLVADFPPLQRLQEFARERFELLPDEYKCFTGPQAYSVSLSEELYQLRRKLIERSRHV